MNTYRFYFASTLLIIFQAGLSSTAFAQTNPPTVQVLAGNGTIGYSGDNGPATQASINNPAGIATDSAGNVYITDTYNFVVRKITAAGAGGGIISTIAGNNADENTTGKQFPAGPATSFPLNFPIGVALGSDGTVYFNDIGIFAVSPGGTLTPDYKSAGLTYLASDGQGNIYAAGQGGTAVYGYKNLQLFLIAGNPTTGGDAGDGGPPSQALFTNIAGIAADANGNVYVSDADACRVRKFNVKGSTIGSIQTIAGTGTCTGGDPTAGDGNSATAAELAGNGPIAADNKGNVYIADGARIRQVNTQGTINPYAGALTGNVYNGQSQPAINAYFGPPDAMTTDSQGNLYLAVGNYVVEITPGVVSGGGCTNKPSIAAVVSATGNYPGVTPEGWVAIYGTNLAPAGDSRPWMTADFNGNILPTSLDGVSVTVDGIPAYVAYISPGQVNILVPDDSNTGQVPVVLTTTCSASNSFPVQLSAVAPEFFILSASTDVIAQHLDYSLVANPPLGTPAKPGETLIVYATGFGPTNPATPANMLVTSPPPLASTYQLSLTVGGMAASVPFAGLIAPGLYQLNVVLPTNLANGEQPILATLTAGTSTSSTQPTATIPIQQ